jgi:hypothetical protein
MDLEGDTPFGTSFREDILHYIKDNYVIRYIFPFQSGRSYKHGRNYQEEEEWLA